MTNNRATGNNYKYLVLIILLPIIVACSTDIAEPIDVQVSSTPERTLQNDGAGDLSKSVAPEDKTIDCSPNISQDACLSLNSITKVDDHPLYKMYYYANYRQDLNTKESMPLETSSKTGNDLQWGCSLFAAYANVENQLFGRNFDWRFSPAILLFTDPEDGYASVSMVDYEYLGYTGYEDLAKLPVDEKLSLLQAPFLPFDGMNEHGLAIGMAAVPSGQVEPNPARETIGSLQIIRLVLDHARNVSEAINLFNQYNIDMGDGPPIHYLISDTNGSSVLLEFYQGDLVVFPNEQSWQEATNFLNAAVNDPKGNCIRFDTIEEVMHDMQGELTVADALSLLEEVSQPTTQWSIVYDAGNLDIAVAMSGKYDTVYDFQLAFP